jgi:hypothetical protein
MVRDDAALAMERVHFVDYEAGYDGACVNLSGLWHLLPRQGACLKSCPRAGPVRWKQTTCQA